MSQRLCELRRLVSVAATACVLTAVALVVSSAPAGADVVIGGCNFVSGPTSVNHTVCPGASLAGADLSGLNLNYANLSGAILTGANLSHTTLTSTDLDHANLHGANLTISALLSTDLAGADLSNSTLNCGGCGWGEVDFTNANLDGVSFAGDPPLLVNPTLTGSTWSGAQHLTPLDQTLQATSPSGANAFWGAPSYLTSMGLTETCDHSSGDLFPLGATVVNCTLTSPDTHTSGTATFTIQVVNDVTLDGCLVVWQPTPSHHTACAGDPLSGIDLHRFNLQYADFSGANLTNANLTSANLEHANLTNANLTSANIGYDIGTLNGADLQYATLTGVNFTNAILANANFSHSTLGITDRTYKSQGGTAGTTMPLSWKAPSDYATVTDLRPYGCNPSSGASFPVGTTTVLCHVAHITNNTGALGFFTFTETILPVVLPGTGTVTAPSSGTADLQVSVSLNTPATSTITVPWTTVLAAGSPTIYGIPQAPASDYTASSGTVTFLPGQSAAIVHIPVSADSAGPSLPEFLLVSFHDPTGAFLGGVYGLGLGLINHS